MNGVMIVWVVFAWLFLVAVICLFMAAANGKRSLWLHLHWPTHRQRMKRAEFCLEVAKHWEVAEFISGAFTSAAYRLCDECGCPADVWPVGVIAIHSGVTHA